MKLKPVFRRDEIQRHFRLFRLLWTRGEVGFGNGGYSAKLSVAFAPNLLHWERSGRHGWIIFLLGLRLHYCRSYGGVMVRPDWKSIYKENREGLTSVGRLDGRENDLVTVTLETARLARAALTEMNARDYYHNNGAALRELIRVIAKHESKK